MKLAIFGCSFTYGIPKSYSAELPDNHINWTRELGKLKPDWIIHNYSLPSCSLLFSLYQIHNLKQDYDKIILQIPEHLRFTYWPTDFNSEHYLRKFEPNVWQMDIKCLNEVKLYTSTIINKNVDIELENAFIKLYKERRSSIMEDFEAELLLKNVDVDLQFAHTYYPNNLNIQDEVGLRWKKFAVDNTGHFNLQGHQWIANWVLDKINTLY